MKLDETYFSGQELSDDNEIDNVDIPHYNESYLNGTVIIYFRTDVKTVDVDKCFASFVMFSEQLKSVSRLIMPASPDDNGEFIVGAVLSKIDVCEILMLYRMLFVSAEKCGLKPEPGGVCTPDDNFIVKRVMHDYIMKPYRAEFNDVRKQISQVMDKDDVWMYEYMLMMFK